MHLSSHLAHAGNKKGFDQVISLYAQLSTFTVLSEYVTALLEYLSIIILKDTILQYFTTCMNF